MWPHTAAARRVCQLTPVQVPLVAAADILWVSTRCCAMPALQAAHHAQPCSACSRRLNSTNTAQLELPPGYDSCMGALAWQRHPANNPAPYCFCAAADKYSHSRLPCCDNRPEMRSGPHPWLAQQRPPLGTLHRQASHKGTRACVAMGGPIRDHHQLVSSGQDQEVLALTPVAGHPCSTTTLSRRCRCS
jgi:hypothetical protein